MTLCLLHLYMTETDVTTGRISCYAQRCGLILSAAATFKRRQFCNQIRSTTSQLSICTADVRSAVPVVAHTP